MNRSTSAYTLAVSFGDGVATQRLATMITRLQPTGLELAGSGINWPARTVFVRFRAAGDDRAAQVAEDIILHADNSPVFNDNPAVTLTTGLASHQRGLELSFA